MAALLTVKHNIEVAHRLWMTPGECQNIHGHSMIVEASIRGQIDPTGKLNGLDFGEIKAAFRYYLDSEFDHHLLLNHLDEWANIKGKLGKLPGVKTFNFDPTTENLARHFWMWIKTHEEWVRPNEGAHVTVYETEVNSATYGDF